jgi:hypothetical protein
MLLTGMIFIGWLKRWPRASRSRPGRGKIRLTWIFIYGPLPTDIDHIDPT